MNATWLRLATGAVADATLSGDLSPTERVFVKRYVPLYLFVGDHRASRLRERGFQIIERSPVTGVIGIGLLMRSACHATGAMGVPILIQSRPSADLASKPEPLLRAEAIARYTLLSRLPTLSLPMSRTELFSLWGTPLSAMSAQVSKSVLDGVVEAGESLTLAGAISALSCYLGGNQGEVWAASGRLSAEGEVRAVDALGEKLRVLLASGARPRYTFISTEQSEHCHTEEWASLNLRAISHLDELIELLWAEAWSQRCALPVAPLIQVARQALVYEQSQEHKSALLLAQYLEPLLKSAEPADELEARVSCELIYATKARYQGDTLQSYARYEALAHHLKKAPAPVRVAAISRALEERVTLKRASALTSLFACEEALGLCEPIRAQPSSQRALMEALGVSARASRLYGRLEEASVYTQAQVQLYFRAEERAERARCLYNHAQALIAQQEVQLDVERSTELSACLHELSHQALGVSEGRIGLHDRHVLLLSWRWATLQSDTEDRSPDSVVKQDALLRLISSCVEGLPSDPLLARVALRLFARRWGLIGEASALLAWARWLERVTPRHTLTFAWRSVELVELTRFGLSHVLNSNQQRRLRALLDEVELDAELNRLSLTPPVIKTYPELIMAYHCLTLAELRGSKERHGLIKIFEDSLRSWGPFGERYALYLQRATPTERKASLAGFCY